MKFVIYANIIMLAHIKVTLVWRKKIDITLPSDSLLKLKFNINCLYFLFGSFLMKFSYSKVLSPPLWLNTTLSFTEKWYDNKTIYHTILLKRALN